MRVIFDIPLLSIQTLRRGAVQSREGGFHVADQVAIGPARRALARYQHIVVSGPGTSREYFTRCGSQPSTGTIAHHRIADPFSDSQSDAQITVGCWFQVIGERCSLQNQSAHRIPLAFAGDALVVGPPLEASDNFRHLYVLSGEALASLGPAARQHLTAILSRHAGTKTMAPLAHKIARLKRPFHGLVSDRLTGRARSHTLETGPLYKDSQIRSQRVFRTRS